MYDPKLELISNNSDDDEMDIRHCPNQSDLRLCPNQSHCDTYISNPENSLKRGIPKFKFLSRSPCDESGVATILPRNAYALDSNIEVRFHYIFKTHTLKWYQLISQRCFHSILWCVYWLDTPFISIVVVEVIVIMKMIMTIMILIILSRHSFYLFIYLFIFQLFAVQPRNSWKSRYLFYYLSRLMTKPTKWLCAQRRLRSA